LPAPHGIIHDKTLKDWPNLENRNPSKPLRVLWVGNSKWGEWIGGLDHKGLSSVIVPAIEIANLTEKIVTLEVIDSSVKKLSHREVLDRMGNADVILQFSESEGTGLPLLEGALQGAVPLTSDVGIAKEFIPCDFQDFAIISRDPTLIAQRLQYLYHNPQYFEAIRDATYSSANDFMLRAPNAWSEFISSALEKPIPRRLDNLALSRAKRIFIRLQLVILDQRVRSLGKSLASYFPVLKTPLIKSYLAMQRKNSQELNFSAYFKVDSLAIYCPKWLGVANSTKNIFENSFPIPHLPSREPDFPSKKELDFYTSFLEKSVISQLVVSGGDEIHIELAKKLKTIRPDIEIRFLWHGGIALLPNTSEYHKFKKILRLYETGIISAIDSVKPGLPEMLRELKVDSNFFMNHTNYSASQDSRPSTDVSEIKVHKSVGIFASSTGWWKNYWNQYFALRSVSEVQGAVLFKRIELDELFRFNSGDASEIGYITDPLEFSRKLSNLDVLLYVTFAECAPMLPLEAMAKGVVVIVGPSTEYIKGTDLESLILISNPDSPFEIRNRLRFVLDNLEFIRSKQFEFLSNYTEVAKTHNKTTLQRSLSVKKVSR
jgi:glycosyltransferase involved in cell wall biosynthesis